MFVLLRRGVAFLLIGSGWAVAQSPAGSTPLPPSAAPSTSSLPSTEPHTGAASQAAQEETSPEHHGQILIQSHGDPPVQDSEAPGAAKQPAVPQPLPPDAKADVSDAERSALIFTTMALDARLNLEQSGLEVRARVTLRNRGQAPLRQLALQISSSLRWESATLVREKQRTPLPMVQHRIETDADHTGAATEAVLSLPEPLAPGQTTELDLFYAGKIVQDSGRLARLGAAVTQGASADWDAIGPQWTGLRGFGNVLWYPVASPQVFLPDGNTLFRAVGEMKAQERSAGVALRLTLAYQGEAPVGAYFCGRHASLTKLADDPNAPVAFGEGVATAVFNSEPLGFRTPSLFVVQQPEVLLGGAASPSHPGAEGTRGGEGTGADAPLAAYSSSADPGVPTAPLKARVPAVDSGEALVALSSADPGSVVGLGAAADRAARILADWMGPRPLSLLTVLDHAGQPFQDGPLLVAPAATLQTSPEQPAMVYSLTHGWIQTGQPWMDEGLAQYFALLSTEGELGREAALAQMNDLLQPVALVEPDLSPDHPDAPGQPLITADDEVFYRRKAAAVWWMLRDVAGEQPLREALRAWRMQPASSSPAAEQALAFEHLLEQRSGKDLSWFFQDWVLRDRGLPDLGIADVEVSRPPASPGHTSGWLSAITVRNDGAAAADVPVVVRSGSFSTATRIRVPGFGRATQRVLSEAQPTEVVVNDGSVPEQRASRHSRVLTAEPAP